MKKAAFVLTVLFIVSLGCQKQLTLTEGTYRLVLIPDTSRAHHELPVEIEFLKLAEGQWRGVIKNADEEIIINEIEEKNDSLLIDLPIFEGQIKLAKKHSNWQGAYYHIAAGRSWNIPAELEKANFRFDVDSEEPLFDVSGRWEVTTNYDRNPETQVGIFQSDGNHVTGTFLTVVGDYRFLEGTVTGNKLYLSGFDGAHALLFEAELAENGDLINGIFIGGPSWQSKWKASRNETITLPDATELTYLKPGYSEIEFSFPDISGDMVSLNDEKFQNKAVIIQIIGSWCPNCMDETRYFAELYDQYKDDGLEIIALCYESKNTEASLRAIKRFKEGTGASYAFLHAGLASKREASRTLPMLNRIISYPTSIFIDREGNIRKIFTGFSGPGTGVHFQELSNEMETLIKNMLFVPLNKKNKK